MGCWVLRSHKQLLCRAPLVLPQKETGLLLVSGVEIPAHTPCACPGRLQASRGTWSWGTACPTCSAATAVGFPLPEMNWGTGIPWDKGPVSVAWLLPCSQRCLGSWGTISSRFADPALTMAHVHNLSSLQWCLVKAGACSPLPVPFVWVIYCSSVPLCPPKFITALTQQSRARNYSCVW